MLIVQDPAYHLFADHRTMLGVPNFLNVISNLPFAVIGVLGLRSRVARIFALAVFATAFGSAWYHLQPNDQTLFWDRLPMAVGFMALLSQVIGWAELPLAAIGAASVVYWRVTGELLPYAIVQFFPLLAIPAILLLRPRGENARPLWTAIGWYAAAKLLEFLDRPIFALGGVVSGHTLKHLAAALATYYVLRFLLSFRKAFRRVPPTSSPVAREWQ